MGGDVHASGDRSRRFQRFFFSQFSFIFFCLPFLLSSPPTKRPGSGTRELSTVIKMHQLQDLTTLHLPALILEAVLAMIPLAPTSSSITSLRILQRVNFSRCLSRLER